MKIVYLKHPVSAEEKAKHRAAGYKIVDAKFAPADEKLVEPLVVEIIAAPEEVIEPVIETANDVELETVENKRRGRPRKGK